MKYIITLLALITLLSSDNLENYLTNNLENVKNNKEIKKEIIQKQEKQEIKKYKKNTLEKIGDSISISGNAVYRYEKKN